MHATDVSDTHSLPSHPDTPVLPPTLYPAAPSPPPLTVTDTLPVLTAFARLPTDIEPTSYVIPTVLLPVCPPAVTISRTDPPTPLPPMHLTDVSDTHSLPSHPVVPTLIVMLCIVLPSPPPITVTDVLPVAPLLLTSKLDTDPTSYDTPSLIDPANDPTVIPTRTVPDTPLAFWHATDVSDSHMLASHPDPPCRIPMLIPEA